VSEKPPVAVARAAVNQKNETLGTYIWIWCPGCDQAHTAVVPDDRGIPKGRVVFWSWNGDVDNLTIGGSILVNAGQEHPDYPLCHSFVRDGRIEFLGDCTHELVGQTVDLPPLPEWLARDYGAEHG